MSFRDAMKVKVSNAELAVFKELMNRGLNRGMTTQVGFDFGVPGKDCVCDGVRGTTADFYWEAKRLVVFIDGPHHRKSHQQRKDELIDAALKRRGLGVLRLAYHVPLSQEKCKKICDMIGITLRIQPTRGMVGS